MCPPFSNCFRRRWPKHDRLVHNPSLAATSTVVYCYRYLFFTYLLLPTISHADTLHSLNPEATLPSDNVPTQPVGSTSSVSLDIRVVPLLVSVKFVQFCTFMFTTKFAYCVGYMYKNAVIYHQTSYWRSNNWYGRRIGKVAWSSLTLNG